MSRTRRRAGAFALAALLAAAAPPAARAEAAGEAAGDAPIALSPLCPAGFEKDADGRCRLQTLYDAYDSLEGRGVGGLRTALPPRRESFTPEQIDLGRLLFFDPVLSGPGTLSCASCHHPASGLSDGRARSVGALGTEVARSAPTLWNVAFLERFFWDGRARSLEEQMQGPLYAPGEMATTPDALLAALNAIPEYRRLFRLAFPREAEGAIALGEVYEALAAFESSLVSLNSRYDRYAHGDASALSPAEIEGMNVFRSFVARCAECHTPPLFTNQQIAVIGVPEADGRPLDPGAGAVSDNPTWRGGFKVPTLRNVARTAPYMHAGQLATLRDAAEFYNLGRGHAVPPGEELTLHWHIWEPKLRDEELDRLVDFMNALTDESAAPEVPARVPSGRTPVNHAAATAELATGADR